MSYCLGHASVGAYSCYAQGTIAVDSHGDGFCEIHATFMKEMEEAICFGEECRYIVWPEGHWSDPNPNCYRCGGTGIDPVVRT